MAAGHIFYKWKTWNAKEFQTYKMKVEWPIILYVEHIFQVFTFNFTWPVLQAPLHDKSVFYKTWEVAI